MSRRDLIDVALGHAPADITVVNGRVVNVLTEEIYEAGVAIKDTRIAAVGDIDYTRGEETSVIDADGRYVTPGLIDGHLHMYHSYLGVNEFVEAMLRRGSRHTPTASTPRESLLGRPGSVSSRTRLRRDRCGSSFSFRRLRTCRTASSGSSRPRVSTRTR